jgi:benzoate membrane transport protein
MLDAHPEGSTGLRAYLNTAAVRAGLTTFIWYAVGLVPVQIAVTVRFGLEAAQVLSWLCIIWLTSGVASLGLSLVYRQPIPIAWALPVLTRPSVSFSASAFVAVSLPLVVLSMGLGNVQGLGFLIAQGYRVPVNATTAILGLTSVVNALFGGHAAIVSRNGMPILAGPDAGPRAGRYWANLRPPAPAPR